MQPRTPLSPSIPSLSGDASSISSDSSVSGQPKRKPSRRANTAERRATHNAVERQRRETLNGRFLDLAALLPNLSQIRRPSKSAIVNSSIAHVHASRRHRLLAARELRLLKLESDALRRELNEWRDRAGLPRVEEPVRSDAFSIVLSAELEIAPAVPEENDEDQCDDDDDLVGVAAAAAAASAYGSVDDIETPSQMMLKHPFAPNMISRAGSNPAISRYTGRSMPMIATPGSGVNYENPSMSAIYEPQYPGQLLQQEVEKVGSWGPNGNMYYGSNAAHHQMMSQHRQLYTPPSSSHGIPISPNSGFNDHTFFASLQRQQMGSLPNGAMYPIDDDSSSVGSAPGIAIRSRERSSSVSTGSGYGGSPPHTASADFAAHLMSRGAVDARNAVEGWREQEMMMKQSVGGGGGGYAMMMM
jgi:hypothetical protein